MFAQEKNVLKNQNIQWFDDGVNDHTLKAFFIVNEKVPARIGDTESRYFSTCKITPQIFFSEIKF